MTVNNIFVAIKTNLFSHIIKNEVVLSKIKIYMNEIVGVKSNIEKL